MSQTTKNLTLEDLYELEAEAQGVFAGSPMTEVEMRRLMSEYLAADYPEKLAAKVEARKQELAAEIAASCDPQKQEDLSKHLALLSQW